MASRSELIDDLISATPGWRGDVIGSLREIIHEADPDIVEDVKWRRPANPAGTAVFEHDGIVCVVVPLKERVRLGFWDGASLPDPEDRFNAQLKGRSRAIDFGPADELPKDSLVALVRAGVDFKAATAQAGRKRK